MKISTYQALSMKNTATDILKLHNKVIQKARLYCPARYENAEEVLTIEQLIYLNESYNLFHWDHHCIDDKCHYCEGASLGQYCGLFDGYYRHRRSWFGELSTISNNRPNFELNTVSDVDGLADIIYDEGISTNTRYYIRGVLDGYLYFYGIGTEWSIFDNTNFEYTLTLTCNMDSITQDIEFYRNTNVQVTAMLTGLYVERTDGECIFIQREDFAEFIYEVGLSWK